VGPHATVSGFSDPDFAIDAAGNVITAGINLANVYVAKSSDSGRTWTGHPFGTVMTDREWLAADEENVVYMNGNQIPGGRRLLKSTNGGLTFNIATGISLPGSGPPSKPEVDKSDGRLTDPEVVSADYRMYAAQTRTGHGWMDDCGCFPTPRLGYRRGHSRAVPQRHDLRERNDLSGPRDRPPSRRLPHQLDLGGRPVPDRVLGHLVQAEQRRLEAGPRSPDRGHRLLLRREALPTEPCAGQGPEALPSRLLRT
jgi:hypothetical protein